MAESMVRSVKGNNANYSVCESSRKAKWEAARLKIAWPAASARSREKFQGWQKERQQGQRGRGSAMGAGHARKTRVNEKRG
eukprot:6182215-Pleurochrysis_carterae.AAC.3